MSDTKQEQTYRCTKCGRKVRPNWMVLADFSQSFGQMDYIGPTCRKKLIASGVPESAFEQVTNKEVK